MSKLKISNLQDLVDYFGAGVPTSLNRRVYKDTNCGASISIQTLDDVWHHNGQDWSQIKTIKAFTIQTIVEGSDAEVNSDLFVLPVATRLVENWMAEMEEEADRLWHEANNEEPEL